MRVAHGEDLVVAEREARDAEAMLADASAEDLRAVVVRAFLGEGEFERREFVALAAGNSADETLSDDAALAAPLCWSSLASASRVRTKSRG